MNNIIAYIGERNTGKTTRLYERFIYEYELGRTILVIDSATEHIEKSIYMKLCLEYKEKIEICSCEKAGILFPNNSAESFPFESIKNVSQRIYLVDVSLFLERGYDYPAGTRREMERLYYKKLSMQVIEVLLEKVDVILMDEIELIPEGRRVLEKIKKSNKYMYMTLHDPAGMAGLSDLIKVERV